MGTKQSYKSDQKILPFYYKLIDDKQNKKKDIYNQELFFNHDSSKLIVNSGFSIEIFSLKFEMLKSIAIIKMQKYISQLKCLSKTNNVMAASDERLITFQSIVTLNHRKLLNNLKINDEVVCFLSNNLENQIFIGSYEKMIILNKLNGWKVHQKIQIGNFYITDLCINETDRYLACRSGEQFSTIFELQFQGIETLWIQKQQIKTYTKQWRQIFVNEDTFIIKQFDQNLLLVYKISKSLNLFLKTQEIYLNGQSKSYPMSRMSFNKDLQILAINNENNIDIIAIINKEKFEIYQTIICKNKAISGSFCLEGKYFAILIQHKTNIQLFKLIIR